MSERLSAVDAAWLRMDRPNNRMMITSILTFDERLELADLERVIEERLLPHQRFRQRVVGTLRGPAWELDSRFDLHSHLHAIAMPAGGLAELVSDLASSPLDRDRPLWQVHVVERVGGGTAVVVRLHHCIGDGFALVRLLLSLTDAERGPEPRWVNRALPRAQGPLGWARLAVADAVAAVRLLTLPPDPETALNGPLGVRKRIAWSAPLPIAPLEQRAHAAGATITDLVLAALAGAFGEHLEAHGGVPEGGEVRAMVPVNLRSSGDGLGNRFGLVYVPLPVGERDAGARLEEVAERMTAAKSSPDAVVAFGVLGLMGLANAAVERFGVELFSRKATVMATSIPGPRTPVWLAGRRLGQLIVFAPASGQIGITLSMISYAGAVTLGVASDERLLPDPQALIAAIERRLPREPAGAPYLGAHAGG